MHRLVYVLVIVMLLTGAAAQAQTTRVSVASDGTQGNGHSDGGALSADGRFVVFQSEASNLVPNDTNNVMDVFLRDRQTNQTTRLSVAGNGAQGNLGSGKPDISADGRFVAFSSSATNLVANDFNDQSDIYLYDALVGDITRLTRGLNDSEPNFHSAEPSISADGRFVAFSSNASNLVGGDVNGRPDVFVVDTSTGVIDMVSLSTGGARGDRGSVGAQISSDGRYVTFLSDATNLVAGDTNEVTDIFVHDRQTRQTTRVNLDSNQVQGSFFSVAPAISGDGRFVVFQSGSFGATQLRHGIFVRDRQTQTLTRVDVSSAGVAANDLSYAPVISDDGRFVVFGSRATNLGAGASSALDDVFVHDRQSGQTTLVSVTLNGLDSEAGYPAISGDGRVVVFRSYAANLVAGDTNSKSDVFARVLPLPCDARSDCSDVPGAPGNLSSVVNGLSVSLTWNAPVSGGPVATYVISAGTAPLANNFSFETGSAATTFASSAPPGTYYVRVSARNAAGTGPPSNEIVVVIGSAGCMPGAPTLVGSVTGNTIALTWAPTGGCGVSSYVIEAGTVPGVSNLAVVNVGNVTSQSAAAPAGTYYIRVIARNSAGTSPPSNEVTLTVGCAAPPNPPSGLTAVLSGRTVTLSWSAPIGGCPVDAYVIEAGTAPGAVNVLSANVGTQTSMVGSGPPGTYYVRVRALNAAGLSGASNEVTVTIQ